MSQMNAFMAQIAADAKLQERVAALPDAESFVALASELGFDISTADIPGFSEAELSEDDLAHASGGLLVEEGPATNLPMPRYYPSWWPRELRG
jgi:predicted ribosomally synthesized peptide with nif11-like leader